MQNLVFKNYLHYTNTAFFVVISNLKFSNTYIRLKELVKESNGVKCSGSGGSLGAAYFL